MTADVRFEVRGLPVPQGSARAFIAGGRAIVVTKGRSPLADWRAAIATEARDAMGTVPPWRGPITIRLEFRPASRPASHYLPANGRRPVRELRLDAPTWHTGKPDGDKLARAALDALTGVVWEDDRQAASIAITKRWPDEGESPGVTVAISRLEATR